MPTKPTHCGEAGCMEKADVIRVLASVKGGKTKLYSFSEIGSAKADVLMANEGVVFKAWRSWCAKHHMNFVVNSGKAQHPKPESLSWTD